MKVTIEITCQADIEKARELLDFMDEAKKDRESVLSKPISILGLGVRGENIITNAMGIKTVGELIKVSATELLRTPNFGRKSFNEVVDGLNSYGLRLNSA